MTTALLLAAAYSALGIVLLALGFAALDLVTPGRLGEHVYTARSLNAAIVVSALFCSLGAIMFTSIWTNGQGLAGLAWTACFGLLGIALQTLAFVVLDALTPGSLAAFTVEERFHPGALVAGAAMLAIGAVVCASIA